MEYYQIWFLSVTQSDPLVTHDDANNFLSKIVSVYLPDFKISSRYCF